MSFDRNGGAGYRDERKVVRVSLYRVHFKWKEKEIELTARNLDLTHPYFVSIKNLVFPTEEKLVINPSEEETRRVFGASDHLMIPFQTVSLIEELPDDNDRRVMSFPGRE